MDDATREIMNAKIDVLFEQIQSLKGRKLLSASNAINLWNSAKIQEAIGMGPMEARRIYKIAYDTLNKMGLEVGGMISPYQSP